MPLIIGLGTSQPYSRRERPRKRSESVSGVFPEFFRNFFQKVPAVLGVWPIIEPTHHILEALLELFNTNRRIGKDSLHGSGKLLTCGYAIINVFQIIFWKYMEIALHQSCANPWAFFCQIFGRENRIHRCVSTSPPRRRA